jgi:hypothetical protein
MLENSGGMSLGCRYQRPGLKGRKSTTTVLINPAMGHFESSYSTPMSKNLNVSTRYNMNMYSLESDVAVGFEFEREGQVLKGRVGFVDGVGCHLMVKREWGSVGVGFESRVGRGGIAQSSIGMEIQVAI